MNRLFIKELYLHRQRLYTNRAFEAQLFDMSAYIHGFWFWADLEAMFGEGHIGILCLLSCCKNLSELSLTLTSITLHLISSSFDLT